MRCILGFVTLISNVAAVDAIADEPAFQGIWAQEFPGEQLDELEIAKRCLNEPVAIAANGDWIGFKAVEEVELTQLMDLSTANYEVFWQVQCRSLRNVDVCVNPDNDKGPNVYLSRDVRPLSQLTVVIYPDGLEGATTRLFRCDVNENPSNALRERLEQAAGKSFE